MTAPPSELTTQERIERLPDVRGWSVNQLVELGEAVAAARAAVAPLLDHANEAEASQ